MKRILITGSDSYIGTSFEKYIKDSFADQYMVDVVDMVDDSWRGKNFGEYDSILHVAAYTHQKETKRNSHLFFEVNRDLTIETALKAKNEGARQFIFLSSFSVYGMDTGVIRRSTKPNPVSDYGKSKLQAEDSIIWLSSSSFKICILRLPNVYGIRCKGDYRILDDYVRKHFFFPKISNQRTALHIDELVKLIKTVVDKGLSGLFLPQNDERVKTIDLAKKVAEREHKKLYFSYLLALVVVLLMPFVKTLRRLFGNLTYISND